MSTKPNSIEKLLSGANGVAEGILAGSAGAIGAGVVGSLFFSPSIGLAFTGLGLRGFLELGIFYAAFRGFQYVAGHDPDANPQVRIERRKVGIAVISLYNAFAASSLAPVINERILKVNTEQAAPAPTQNSVPMMK